MLEKVITYLKEHFYHDDYMIIALLAQGAGTMRDIQKKMNEECDDFIPGFDDMMLEKTEQLVAYLDDVLEECSPL